MLLLDLANWYPVWWDSMPKLQSLRLGAQQWSTVPWSELPPLKMLALSRVNCTSVLRHSQSLTTLMLSNVILVDVISGPVTFPSLTYLSLSCVTGLKPHVNAPRLLTYHESGIVVGESFNIPLPSLVEYGVYYMLIGSSDPAMWHFTFPNIQQLAIRVDEFVLLPFFDSLANQPHILPALQTISTGARGGSTYHITSVAQRKIESLVLARNEACDVNVMVYFEGVLPFQIPIFFGSGK